MSPRSTRKSSSVARPAASRDAAASRAIAPGFSDATYERMRPVWAAVQRRLMETPSNVMRTDVRKKENATARQRQNNSAVVPQVRNEKTPAVVSDGGRGGQQASPANPTVRRPA